MTTRTVRKWQWVDNLYGEMGWFDDEEKAKHEAMPEFSNGKWIPISPEEVASMNAYIGRLAYEQG